MGSPMDPSEIMHAAPQLVKAVAPIAAAVPFTGIVKRMLGPAADELAEMWRDQIRLYRYGRQIKCVEKAEKMAEDAGFTPNAVPPKILFPLLEGASFEEDETLHTMWASLLANASSKKGAIVRPTFISLLKNMAPDEAELLRQMAERTERLNYLGPELRTHYKQIAIGCDPEADDYLSRRNALWLGFKHGFHEFCESLERTFVPIAGEEESEKELRYEACFTALEDAGLIERSAEDSLADGKMILSSRGKTFLAACSPPRPE
jgi:Abortive infection alpha